MTTRSALRLTVAALALLASLSFAETTYLPGAAEVAGLAGARFSSTLDLTNTGSAGTTVTIGLVPMAGKPTPAPVTRTLAASESLRIPSVLKTLFGLADGAAGTITVTSADPLLASLSTQNVAAAEGAYGLGLLPVPESELLGAGETGHSIWVSQSADPSTGYRTNLSVTLADAGSVVEVRVFDGEGRLAGSTTVTAETPAVWQQAATAVAGPADLPIGRAEFEVKTGRATAYAVVNDNVTSDAIALQSERIVPGPTDRLVSGAALSPGHLGSFWSTDLRLFNPGSATVEATILSVGTPGAASTNVAVPAKGVVELPRVLALLGFPEGTACALRVKGTDALLVAARTNNVDPSGVRKGTFSAQQFVTSWPAGLLGTGATGFFNGVDQTMNVPGVRTNLTLVGGPEGASGELVLRDAAGVEQGRAAFTRAPSEWGQRSVADWFGASASLVGGLAAATVPENARIDVLVGTGALDAFVSRIDNGSGDAVTRPVALPGGGDCAKVAITSFGAAPQPVRAGVETSFSWTVAVDPPSAQLTSQSIRFDGEAEIELGKDVRSYARTFAATGARSATLTVRKGSCVKTRALAFYVCGDLAVEPLLLPEGIAFTPYPNRQLTAPGSTAPTTFAVTAGALPDGLTLSAAGVLSGVPTDPATFTFTVTATDANGCTGSREYSLRIACPNLAISPATLPTGTVGVPYATVRLSASGGSGTGTWSATGLPLGLAISADGRLTGTPTAAGSFPVIVRFRDSTGCDEARSYTILVCNTLVVAPSTLAAATAGIAYGPVPFSAAGASGATTWSVTAGALPAGLTLDPVTGILSGTSTVVGSFPFTVTATDSLGCTGSVAVTLLVGCPTITVSPTSLGGGTAGVAYVAATLTRTGGVGAVTWSVTAGSLPAGMSLSPAGVLSGTPTVVGSFPFTATATDANGCTGSQAYSLVIACPTITLGPLVPATGTAGVAYSATLGQTGGVGTVTYAITGGALPTGMSLQPSGALTGTPLVTGPFSFTVTATDANGCTGAQGYTLTIACPAIAVSPASVAAGTAGVAYAPVTFTQTGGVGTIAWSVIGTLPNGLSLDPGTGVLSGTPLQTGSFPVTVRATDANSCTGDRAITLTIQCPTIAVDPATIPSGTTGVAYAGATFTQTGGVGTIGWSISAGTLPTGLTLNPATGLLSGTPLQAGAFPITVRATDANGCFGDRSLTLTVVCPAIAVAPASLPGGTVGTPYAQNVSASGGGGTYLYSVVPGTLPPGLSLNGTSGAITGTPTTAGLYAFTVTATDQYGCSGATSYSVRICPVVTVTPTTAPQATINLPYGPVAFGQTGGALPIAWSAAGLPAGLTIDAASGALSGTPTQAGAFSVTVTATDANGCPGAVTFTLRVCPDMSILPATLGNGVVGTAYGPVTFTQSGSAAAITWSATGLPASLSLDPGTGVLSGTPETPGSSTVVVTATDANGCAVSRTYTLVVDCPAITLSPGTLSAGTAGTAYSETITATSALAGGSYSFSVQTGTLPPGLTLAAGGGLTGTPTAVGTFAFTVRATHAPSGCTGDQAYSITVSCGTITVGGGAPPTNVTAGVAGYTHTFTASGGLAPLTFSHTGTLPPGLTLSAGGVLSGTPTAAGTFPFTIVATDAATGATCTGSAPFSVTVVCPTITVSPATLPDGSLGVSYSQSVTAAGGTGTYTFAVTAGALPTGLALAGDGTISGTPTAAGTFTFTITATDSTTSCTGSRAYTVRVCPVITLTAISTCAEVGVAYSSTITAPAGAPTVAFAVTGGTVPPGLTLAAGGTLSGTPTAAGQFSFTVTATDANSCTGSQAYTVNVLGLTPAAGALPEATFGSAYSQTFTASGGSGAFTFAVTSGSIPGGLTLSAAGVLSGTPTGATGTGSFSFTVTATNTATGCAIARAYTLVSRPVAVANTYTDGAGNTQYAAGGYAPAPTTPFVSNATNILTNDLGPGLVPSVVTQPANGTVTLNADGSFLFTPSAGATTSASFTYKVTSNLVDSANATVTITLTGKVWYVNSAAAAGNGTSSSPFNSMGSADTASVTGETVFVHTGGATTPGAIALEAAQVLWGQGTAFSLAGTGLSIPAGGKPTLTGTVTLGGNNIVVSSLDVSTSSATGLTDNQAGAITGITVQNNVTVTSANAAAVVLTDVTSAVGGMLFTSVTSSGSGTSGVSLTNVSGTFNAAGGSITNATGTDFLISGGTANVTYAGTITDDDGALVSVASATGGTKTFSGAITDGNDGDGSGISLTNNTGATITFSGGLVLSTGANPAFTATGGGTINVCDESGCNPAATGPLVNTLTTTTGTALNVANTTIGASNLEFRSVSAGTGATGPTNGIVLDNTGTAGGLKVKGTGAAGTGGTIQRTTGAGVALSSTSLVSFSYLNVQNGGDDGIRGSSITSLSLTGVQVTTNGNAVGEAGLDLTNLFGTSAWSGVTVSGSAEDNVVIRNSSGTLNSLSVTGSTFSNNSAIGNDGFLVEASGTASITVSVTGNTFTANRGDHFQAAGVNSGILDVTFTGNTLTGGHPTALGQGITINAATGVAFGGYTGRVDYDIDGNSINGSVLTAITVSLGTSGAGGIFDGFVRNNVIGTTGQALSCSAQAHGIAIDAHGNGTHTSSVTGNTIRRCADQGIAVLANDGNGSLNLTVAGNTITEMLDTNAVNGTPREAVNLNLGATSTNVFGQIDSHATCLAFGGAGGLANNLTGGAFKNGDIRIRQRFRTSVVLPGYTPPGGNNFDTASVIAFLQGNNLPAGVTATATSFNDAGVTTDGYFGGAGCPQPSP